MIRFLSSFFFLLSLLSLLSSLENYFLSSFSLPLISSFLSPNRMHEYASHNDLLTPQKQPINIYLTWSNA